MNRHVAIRRAMLRLARLKELSAIQQVAESVVALGKAVSLEDVEQRALDVISSQYLKTSAAGHVIELSRYGIFGALSHAGASRLDDAKQCVAVARASASRNTALLNEASDRKGTHLDRLHRLENELRSDVMAREQEIALATWIQTRTGR